MKKKIYFFTAILIMVSTITLVTVIALNASTVTKIEMVNESIPVSNKNSSFYSLSGGIINVFKSNGLDSYLSISESMSKPYNVAKYPIAVLQEDLLIDEFGNNYVSYEIELDVTYQSHSITVKAIVDTYNYILINDGVIVNVANKTYAGDLELPEYSYFAPIQLITQISSNGVTNTSLTKLTLSKSINILYESSISNNPNLSSLVLGEKLKALNKDTITNNPNLTSIYFSKEVSEIHPEYITGSPLISNYYVDDENPNFYHQPNGVYQGVIFHKNTSLLDQSFEVSYLWPVAKIVNYVVLVYNDSQKKVYGVQGETINFPINIVNIGKVDSWYYDRAYTKLSNAITFEENPKYYYAKIVDFDYKIFYHDIDQNNAENKLGFNEGDPIVSLYSVEKHNYKFIGFYDVNDQLINSVSTNLTQDIDVWAKWEFLVKTVTYLVNTQEVVDTYNVNDQSIELRTPGLKENYNFLYWIDASGFPVDELDPSLGIDFKLTAVFERKSYNIYYLLGNGEVNSPLNSLSYTYLEEIDLYPASKEDHEFIQFVDEKNNVINELDTSSKKDIFLYPVFKKVYYEISFLTNVGEPLSPIKYNIYQEEPIVLDNNNIKGYDFNGWIDTNWLSLTEVSPTIEKDLVLYGNYTLHSYQATLRYDTIYGRFEENNYFTIEDDLDFAPAEFTGYDFKEWYSDSVFLNLFDKESFTNPRDIVLWGKLDSQEYTITYYIYELLYTQKVKYFELFKLKTYQYNYQYCFEGWKLGDTFVTDQDGYSITDYRFDYDIELESSLTTEGTIVATFKFLTDSGRHHEQETIRLLARHTYDFSIVPHLQFFTYVTSYTFTKKGSNTTGEFGDAFFNLGESQFVEGTEIIFELNIAWSKATMDFKHNKSDISLQGYNWIEGVEAKYDRFVSVSWLFDTNRQSYGEVIQFIDDQPLQTQLNPSVDKFVKIISDNPYYKQNYAYPVYYENNPDEIIAYLINIKKSASYEHTVDIFYDSRMSPWKYGWEINFDSWDDYYDYQIEDWESRTIDNPGEVFWLQYDYQLKSFNDYYYKFRHNEKLSYIIDFDHPLNFGDEGAPRFISDVCQGLLY